MSEGPLAPLSKPLPPLMGPNEHVVRHNEQGSHGLGFSEQPLAHPHFVNYPFMSASTSSTTTTTVAPPPPPPHFQIMYPEAGPTTHPQGPPPPGTQPLPFVPPPPPEHHPEPPQYYQPSAAELYARSQHGPPLGAPDDLPGGPGVNHYPSANGVPRLPPILQVEKVQVTTSATQLASASRRRNEAHFVCPVPGCGSTFTRRFNLRGHLRSHTEERPYVCEWPNCKKGFARQHDCKRHYALHTAKSQTNVCVGCKKTFSRLDALNRHLRSDGGAECRAVRDQMQNQPEEMHQPPQPPQALPIPPQPQA